MMFYLVYLKVYQNDLVLPFNIHIIPNQTKNKLSSIPSKGWYYLHYQSDTDRLQLQTKLNLTIKSNNGYIIDFIPKNLRRD